ncbi:MAG: hypothetical protein ATN35_01270 [Epulopiscium sp. Nele67-Bin004]|nr:MAG: hypothetical protein ATN35_01270 [Epulopiscium sp. Nele67-Bin004]
MSKSYEKVWFLTSLTFLAGFLNAYTYITRNETFAIMQTANMSKIGISLALQDYDMLQTPIFSIIFCVLGGFFCEFLKNNPNPKYFDIWQRKSLFIEFMAFFVVAFVPMGVADVAVISAFSFIAQMQLSTFGKWYGGMHNTTICTGDLRNFAQSVYRALIGKKDLDIARDTLIMVCSFPLGSFVGIFVSQMFQERASWFGCIILAVLYVAIAKTNKL